MLGCDDCLHEYKARAWFRIALDSGGLKRSKACTMRTERSNMVLQVGVEDDVLWTSIFCLKKGLGSCSDDALPGNCPMYLPTLA
jgi:hypothetical protein